MELEHGQVLATERGDIAVFHANAVVWARDARATAEAKDEMRDWPGLQAAATSADFTLSADAAKRLATSVTDLLRTLHLLGREAGSATVQLEQVSMLDAKGKELKRGASAKDLMGLGQA